MEPDPPHLAPKTDTPERAEKRQTRTNVLALVEQRDRLRAELAANQDALHEAVRGARAAGWGATNIARFVGVTRRVIYNILESEKSPRPVRAEGLTTTPEVPDAAARPE